MEDIADPVFWQAHVPEEQINVKSRIWNTLDAINRNAFIKNRT